MTALPTGLRAGIIACAVALLSVACSSADDATAPSTPAAASGSITSLTAGAQELDVLSTDTPVNPGTIRFGFALITVQGGHASGGTPQVFAARDLTTTAQGPFSAVWFDFTGYQKTGDTSPQTNLDGTYAAQLQLTEVGNWVVAVVVTDGSTRLAGTATVQVTDQDGPAALGTKATSVRTPVATSDAKIAEICTRKPVDTMHYISLDKALTNGKPTVVNFGTPLLCESRLCGPVIDEQILVFEKYGPTKANFIHVEEFPPGADLQPPPATEENIAEPFRAWGFDSEPWIIVIDRDGMIRARFEGPVVASEIEAALQPLL
jgi:hypothetical protein